MKVTFKYGISGFTGKVDGNSIYFHKEARRFIVRRLCRFTERVQTGEFRAVQKNLWRIHPSEAYKNDLRQYIIAYRKLNLRHKANYIAWSNVWQAMMYALARQEPGIDLATITRAEIISQGIACVTVNKAVLAGLLLSVDGFEQMDHQI